MKVNGEVRQNANLRDMIWSVAEQISELSRAFELIAGDIIYSGGPENVGPVVVGDLMEPHRRFDKHQRPDRDCVRPISKQTAPHQQQAQSRIGWFATLPMLEWGREHFGPQILTSEP